MMMLNPAPAYDCTRLGWDIFSRHYQYSACSSRTICIGQLLDSSGGPGILWLDETWSSSSITKEARRKKNPKVLKSVRCLVVLWSKVNFLLIIDNIRNCDTWMFYPTPCDHASDNQSLLIFMMAEWCWEYLPECMVYHGVILHSGHPSPPLLQLMQLSRVSSHSTTVIHPTISDFLI